MRPRGNATDLDDGRAIPVNDLERPVSTVLLDVGVVKPTADKALGVEHGVLGVHRSLQSLVNIKGRISPGLWKSPTNLVLGSITDQTLLRGESNIGRGGAVALCK
jgi:hypothetical protein